MIKKLIAASLSPRQKRFVKANVQAARIRWAKVAKAYTPGDLVDGLRALGINDDDTLLVHANFKADSGFRGSPNDVVTALIDLVGERGDLLMCTMPFRGLAFDHLLKGRVFDVRRTVSMMGLITEMFRRRAGTVRSLHPTHPVAIYGPRSRALAEGHENCRFPCGNGTPFEKFRNLNGKILFFDVGFGANTFFHHVEDFLKDRLSCPLYADELFCVDTVDQDGHRRRVETYAFLPGIVRHTGRLEAELNRRGLLRHGRTGNSRFILVDAADMVTVMTELIDARIPLIERPLV